MLLTQFNIKIKEEAFHNASSQTQSISTKISIKA